MLTLTHKLRNVLVENIIRADLQKNAQKIKSTPVTTTEINHIHMGLNTVSCFSLSCVVWHQEEGGERGRGSGCYGAGLRGQPHPSKEGGSHRLRRRGRRGEHRGYGHEIHPDPAHGYVQ